MKLKTTNATNNRKTILIRIMKAIVICSCSVLIYIGLQTYSLNQEFVSVLQADNFHGAEKLLDRGANPNISFLPKLITANVIKFILTYVRDRKKLEKSTTYPIHLAAEKGQIRLIEKLLKNGAYINQRDGRGDTALIIASYERKYETVRLLLNHGADANIYDLDNSSAFEGACMRADTKLIEMLLPNVADVNHVGLMNRTPLNMYVSIAYNDDGSSKKTDSNIVKKFLAAGADDNIPDINGITPLYNALDKQDYKLAKILLENNAEIDIMTCFRRSSRNYIFAYSQDDKYSRERAELRQIVLKRKKQK